MPNTALIFVISMLVIIVNDQIDNFSKLQISFTRWIFFWAFTFSIFAHNVNCVCTSLSFAYVTINNNIRVFMAQSTTQKNLIGW